MTSREIWRSLTIALIVAVGAGLAAAQEARVPVEKVTLDNGLKLLLVERHDAPSVAGGWVAHVGSANESYGITGIAHLFEHMMFKGSETIGTSDYQQERQIIEQLDMVRTEMEAEYSKLREAKRRGEVEGSIYLPENQTERLAQLREKMKELQTQQKELIVKDEFDQIYTERGGSSMNAFTNTDMTAYFITVPSNKLELWFWMESERLYNSVLREFYSERDVVREERRLRTESDPTAKFEEQFSAMFWTGTPYHHPVVGWPSDVESISKEQAEEFYDTYYAPNNLTAALVGDFETGEAVRLAKKYFGRIPRGEKAPPEVVTEPIPQLQERRMVAEADTNPSVQIRWMTVPFVHKDAYALSVMADLLSDRTGRLYKALVEDERIATGEPYAFSSTRKYAGMFEIGAELTDDATHEQVENALLAEIDRLRQEPVPDRELQKVKNQALANSFRRLQSNFFLLIQLLYYDALGDWTFINTYQDEILAVTAEDVRRVAETYFIPEGRNTLHYHRKAGTQEDPELAALTGQAKQFAKTMLARIAAAEDPAQLKVGLEQMKAGAGQAPAELKPAVELVIRKMEERISELEADSGEEE